MSCLAMIYGPSGLGKTVDAVAALPNAVIIGQYRNLVSAERTFGLKISESNVRNAKTMPEVLKHLQEAVAAKRDVIVDDLSPLAEYTILEYRKNKSGYEVFGALGNDILKMRQVLEMGSSTAIFTAHLGAPHTSSLGGQYIRGGPKLPGQSPELIVTAFDLILRLEADGQRMVGHHASYLSAGDPSYVYKDRFNVVPHPAPVNIGEIMRAAGFTLKRAPGMEWLDNAVPKMASFIVQAINLAPFDQAVDYTNVEAKQRRITALMQLNNKEFTGKAIVAPLRAGLTPFTTERRVQDLALRDAIDRVLIRDAMREKALDAFGG